MCYIVFFCSTNGQIEALLQRYTQELSSWCVPLFLQSRCVKLWSSHRCVCVQNVPMSFYRVNSMIGSSTEKMRTEHEGEPKKALVNFTCGVIPSSVSTSCSFWKLSCLPLFNNLKKEPQTPTLLHKEKQYHHQIEGERKTRGITIASSTRIEEGSDWNFFFFPSFSCFEFLFTLEWLCSGGCWPYFFSFFLKSNLHIV